MTNSQVLAGLALSGILPAPMGTIGAFVGYLGDGLAGAAYVAAGVYLPVFAFTLIGYAASERDFTTATPQIFLDGVTVGVAGLIPVTTLTLLRAALTDAPVLVTFVIGFVLLSRWTARVSVPVVLLGAALATVLVPR
jgi:chromate transporter